MSLLPSLRVRTKPRRSLRGDQTRTDSFFADYPALAEVGAKIPALNIAETKDAVEITTELPGVDEKDINVSLDGNRLVISGEKKQESDHTEKA